MIRSALTMEEYAKKARTVLRVQRHLGHVLLGNIVLMTGFQNLPPTVHLDIGAL